MKSFFCYVILMSLLISCDPTERRAQLIESSKQKDNPSEHLDIYFEALRKLDKFNGAVLVRNRGNTVLYEAYNMSMDAESSLYITKESQFDVHSVSKLMAKACIVQLEQDGLLKKSDLINKYIPGFPNGKKITIQHLLDNQSGLPRDFDEEYENLIERSPTEIIDLIKQEDLLFEPGSDAVYSNLGYQLVYFIIAKVSDQPFVTYLRDQFFIPLDMKHSGAHFYINMDNLINLAQNNTQEDDEIVSVPNILNTSKNQAKVYSNLEDLAKFIDHVSKEPFRSALMNRQNNIGWSGGGEGILCHASANLNGDYELFFFANYDEIPFGDILNTVDLIMTGKPFELPIEINRQAVRLEEESIEKFAGKYRMTEFNNDIFEIRVEQRKLVFYQNGERNSPLYAENDSTLFAEPGDEDYFVLRKNRNKEYDLIFKYKGIDIVGRKLFE